jgi:formylglycine-generating enzyme required for sulfatase activity
VGWYEENSIVPKEVAGKQANDFGLFDMSGNVW